MSKHKQPYKEFVVKDDGIHLIDHAYFHKNFEVICKDYIVIPKDIFIEAFNKYIIQKEVDN